MYLANAHEMKEIDARAIKEMGVPGLALMENAGRAVAEEALRMLAEGPEEKQPPRPGDPGGDAVLVLCGRGNNGGDGLVAARLLHEAGVGVRVFLVGEKETLSDDAAANRAKLEEGGVRPAAVRGEEGLGTVREAARGATVAIEALFGTGLSRPVEGVASGAVALLNKMRAEGLLRVLAVDLPTGLHADTGETLGETVRADCTVTLAVPKTGLFCGEGRSCAGRVVVADIGIPAAAVEAQRMTRHVFLSGEARAALPVRSFDAHKGIAGHVLLVGASPGLTGAAALAAEAALRVGAGLVTVAVPADLNPILEVKLTEAMTLPVPQSNAGTHSARGFRDIERIAKDMKAMAIGPGLSRHEDAQLLARRIVSGIEIPMVIDADGLNAFAGRLRSLRPPSIPRIITPHPGEMARLLDCRVIEVTADPVRVAREAAERAGLVVVLKSAPVVVAEPNGQVWFNSSGNPGLATGGTGDVLTGAVLGFLSQGIEASLAARLGVFVHGTAGDLLARAVGPIGFLAGDVARALPHAMSEIREST